MDKKKKKRIKRTILLGVIAMIVSVYIGSKFEDQNGKRYAPAQYFEAGTKFVSF
ncbi:MULTISPECIES: hypothetical protein [unclassified Bacillus (in: firmicutes)]|uniref:hypothetical protein n=1 Tax=unclassified Bacillus (in: firmicutes) TaxID=185979 RepID=UPI001596F866|nr:MULTISPECIES: hypothetical protein [unclassified Bacillus (in: firmicutes)]